MTGSVHNRPIMAKAQRVIPLCLCCLLTLAAIAPARAQSKDVLNRITHLENELDTLNRAVYKGEKPPASSNAAAPTTDAATFDRLQRMENELRDLTGKVEQQSYDNQQLQMRFDALSQDAQMRLDTIEGQLRKNGLAAQQPVVQGAPPTPLPGEMPPAPSSANTSDAAAPVNPATNVTGQETGLVAGDAAALYEQGFGQIKREDYDAAEKTFSSFLKQYPDHALAPNALYWLGETYYVRKNYTQSARVFAEAYRKYPNGPKAADNLLKLGMSLGGGGKKADACVALGQLKKQYPNGPAPVLTRGDQEMTALGCQS